MRYLPDLARPYRTYPAFCVSSGVDVTLRGIRRQLLPTSEVDHVGSGYTSPKARSTLIRPAHLSRTHLTSSIRVRSCVLGAFPGLFIAKGSGLADDVACVSAMPSHSNLTVPPVFLSATCGDLTTQNEA